MLHSYMLLPQLHAIHIAITLHATCWSCQCYIANRYIQYRQSVNTAMTSLPMPHDVTCCWHTPHATLPHAAACHMPHAATLPYAHAACATCHYATCHMLEDAYIWLQSGLIWLHATCHITPHATCYCVGDVTCYMLITADGATYHMPACHMLSSHMPHSHAATCHIATCHADAA
jgi:hypothetical protein